MPSGAGSAASAASRSRTVSTSRRVRMAADRQSRTHMGPHHRRNQSCYFEWLTPAAIGLLLLVAVAPDASAQACPRPASQRPICHSCFWRWFPELKDELVKVYGGYECKNTFCKAEVAYLLGTVLE